MIFLGAPAGHAEVTAKVMGGVGAKLFVPDGHVAVRQCAPRASITMVACVDRATDLRKPGRDPG